MSENSGTEEVSNDRFEMATAFLLGFAALGAAIASLQAGQWGGKQLEAFSESNTMTTLAARDYNEAVSSMNADYAIVASAKQLLIDAALADTDADEERKLRSVSYLYSEQLTWQAMKALGLPEAMWSAERADEAEEAPPAPGAAAPAAAAPADAPAPAPAAAPEHEADPAAAAAEDDQDDEDAEDTEDAAPVAAPEAVAAAPADAPAAAPVAGDPAAAPAAAEPASSPSSPGEAAIEAAMANMLPEELLWGTIDVELHDEASSYGDDLFSDSIAQFDAASAKFREGQTANNNGDQFDLVGVYYTVALFFAGLGLVFKTRIRWPFFGLGAIVFLGASIFMAMQPWAG